MIRVFIIGAGSNTHLGFPTGVDLRNRILEGGTPYDDSEDNNRFINAFRLSQSLSIDKFISENLHFGPIAKNLITYHISKSERLAVGHVFNTANTIRINHGEGKVNDHWYSYLFNKALINVKSEDKFIFVSFNYDRTIEHYFNTASENYFIEPPNLKVEQKFEWMTIKSNFKKKFEFLYVYGVLGH